MARIANDVISVLSGFPYRHFMDQVLRLLSGRLTKRRWRVGTRPARKGGLVRRRLLLVTPVVVGLALVTSACGGGSPNAGVAGLSTTTTAAPVATGVTSSVSSGGSLVEFATCMRSHGVSNFPDSASLGSSASIKAAKGEISRITNIEGSSSTFEAATRACAKYAPTTAPPQHVSPQEMQKLLAVSRCMRTHGVPNFPDPNPTTGALNNPAGIDKNSPQVLAALQACRSLGEAAGLGPPST
jgi:hypothetical protein